MKRLAIVEDHRFFVQALGVVLAKTEGMEVVASVGTVEDGVKLASGSLDFDLAVVDLMLPDGDGAEVVRVLKQKRPGTPVAVLSASEDLSAALDAGADAAISKQKPLPEVIASLSELAG